MNPELPTRAPSRVIALTRIALGLLAATVLLGQIALVPVAQSTADRYPEFANLHVPLLVATLTFGLCIEIVLVVVAVLVGFIRNGRIFGPGALRLVDVIVFLVSVATVLVAAVLPMIPGPPALGLIMLAGALVGATFVLVLLVLRSLLRQAISMRVELDEVV
ncbi:MAG: Integral rane protein [Microbacteriaceae bacterium]|jgi:hypothetical protein|nr:Integral rane protein [Microbacteriaceae bacterium]